MNKKQVWMVIPAALLPYLALLTLATIFLSTKYSFFEYVMESIFRNNALYLLAALLLYCIIAASISILSFVLSTCKGWDALSLAKSAVILKLIHVPAYVLIFGLGILLTIAIFTIPFSFGLFLLDCLTLFLSGLLTTASIINAVRQGVCKFKDVFWVIILQFIFCADVVAAIILYKKLRKSKIHEENA